MRLLPRALLALLVIVAALGVPVMLTAATDTRHYEALTRNVDRFVPAVLTPEMFTGAHGTNERIRGEDFAHGIRFGAQLMKNAQER